MRVHVRCYCCINYSLAIFTSQRISVLSFSISYFSQSRPLCPQRGDCGQTYKSSPPTQPHKSMPADFYWPITHWVMVVWAGRLSPQQCHRAACAVVCGCEWMGMREKGGFLHCTRLTDRWTVLRPGGGHQDSSPCSAAAAGHFQDLERIRESDSICFPSLFPGESKGKTLPAVPPDWARLT